jgi:PAS domain-containing protein
MAGKNWQAGSKSTLATAVVCLVASAFPAARTPAAPGGFQPSSYVGSLDPNMIWEVLIGSIVVASFVGAVTIWVVSALRRARRSQLRRNAFISTALNHLNQGVVMVDPRGRVIFCNDQYLNLYGLTRADVPRNMTGEELLEMRRTRGVLQESDENFYTRAATPEGLVTELPDGRSVLVKYFALPNGGSVATHLDCTEQRKLARKLSSTTQFLESVLDNVPVCVAAKSI